MSGVRSSARWQKVRAEVLRDASHCAVCFRALDFNAPARSPRAPSVDHVLPLAHGGEPFERTNLQAVCVSCNSRKGASLGAPPRRREPVVTPWPQERYPDAVRHPDYSGPVVSSTSGAWQAAWW